MTVGSTVGSTNSRSANWTSSVSETLAPMLKDLPAAVHSKENVSHLAAEAINQLPTGTAIVKALVNGRIESAIVRVPLVGDAKEKVEGYAKGWLLDRMPLALPHAKADQLIQERHEWLRSEGLNLIDEPESPGDFRVAAPPRTY